MKTLHTKRRGFTLFEVTLVLLILGIAAAALAPAVGSNIRSPKLRAAANVLASDIEYCISECVAQPNSPRAISFNTSTNRYSLINFSSSTVLKHPMDSLDFINDFSTGRNTQFSGVTISSITMGSGTLSVLTFDAYGKPVVTADYVVTLTYSGQSMQITVSKSTGDVTVTGG